MQCFLSDVIRAKKIHDSFTKSGFQIFVSFNVRQPPPLRSEDNIVHNFFANCFEEQNQMSRRASAHFATLFSKPLVMSLYSLSFCKKNRRYGLIRLVRNPTLPDTLLHLPKVSQHLACTQSCTEIHLVIYNYLMGSVFGWPDPNTLGCCES